MATSTALASAASPAAAGQAAAATQASVADPAISAWVSANAGTGKTHVLTQRVLRLLLSGVEPEAVLCLTYTNAASAEMTSRVMGALGRWAALDDAALAAALSALTGATPSAAELERARCLFPQVLDAPGGLKIMTIHAFCERVLRRFPLEAGVSPVFALLSEEEQSAHLSEASDAVLHLAASAPDSEIGQALAIAVAYAEEQRFDLLVREIMPKRDELAALFSYCGEQDAFGRIDYMLRDRLGISASDTLEAIEARQAALCWDDFLTEAVDALREGSTVDQKSADRLAQARGLAGPARIEAFARAFLTEEGKPRADTHFVTKKIRNAYPAIADPLLTARDSFAKLAEKRSAVQTATATLALLRLADAIFSRYDEDLAERSALDFDGVIAKTAQLLHRSDAASWVLYRLDADLAHLLIDEAQDTSPAQWELIKALTAEFFAGEGADDKPRTLFAVGDEKQSIFGFQGADPEQFAATGDYFATRAIAAGAPWRQAPLTLSFRSTSAVLETVDSALPDLAAMAHDTHRIGEAGLVEIWPVIRAQKPEPSSAWQPFAEDAKPAEPCTELAELIARQIRHWVDSGEMLTSQNRPIRSGDILILVRRRKPFADAMVKALKERDIPVAGADRMRLTEQLAVMDLMALGEALLLPEDDLALATLLKTPLFGFTDDDLFAIGHRRPGSLRDALRANGGKNAAYAEAAERLSAWRDEALALAPYEFYMGRLEHDGMRTRLLAALGPEARDPLDEFLNLALTFEASETPTLQGFLHWLRVANPQIKRDMEQDRDEVRVMTVHGAKGLEAEIVFLPDTCSLKPCAPLLVFLEQKRFPPGAPKLPVWLIQDAKKIPVVKEACDALKLAENREQERLLYVAMTRARDRLYVCGFTGGGERELNRGCWFERIGSGMAGRLLDAEDAFGQPVRRFETLQTAPVMTRPAAPEKRWSEPPPSWLEEAAAENRHAGRIAALPRLDAKVSRA